MAIPPAVVLMGVSGTGKSSVMAELRARLGWDALEGDDLHPPWNMARMRAGTPLTDADRAPWLAAIAAWMAERRAVRRPARITCSALRRAYRDVLRGANPGATFVHLVAPEAVLRERLATRKGHAFAPSLLPSQLATLEPLEHDERGFEVDVTESVDVVAERVLASLLPLRQRPRPSGA